MDSKRFLMEGAAYSLQQCGTLLRDAVLLYRAGSYSSAVVLATFGREELGKHQLLREAFDKFVGGEPVVLDEVLRKCLRHDQKQTSGMLSVPFQSSDPAVHAAFAAITTATPGSDDWLNAKGVFDALIEKTAGELPGQRHELRMSALYVNAKKDGSGWFVPRVEQRDAKEQLHVATSDYKVAVYRVLEIDGEFQREFAAWDSRPRFPEVASPIPDPV